MSQIVQQNGMLLAAHQCRISIWLPSLAVRLGDVRCLRCDQT